MSVTLVLDHLVVSAQRLEEGVAHVEKLLGITMSTGGKHSLMGTHNALLGLGDSYLEVIAPDPEAPKPQHPRMFDLDNFRGPPRLTNWVVRTDDLGAALALAPSGAGQEMALNRGDLNWVMSVPDDGCLPFDGGFPAMICWQGDAHPVHRLPDVGCRLAALQVGHPDGAALRKALAKYDGGLEARIGMIAHLSFRAALTTPKGLAVLS